MAYITAQELQNASADAGTLEKFGNDPIGRPNINRVGDDVENLNTLRGKIYSEIDSAAAFATQAGMARDGAEAARDLAQDAAEASQSSSATIWREELSQAPAGPLDEGTPLRVTKDPADSPSNPVNGLYNWSVAAGIFVRADDSAQPASKSSVDTAEANAVRALDETSDLADDVVRPELVGGLWPAPWSIADADGNFFAWIDAKAGAFRSMTDLLPGLPYVGGEFRYRVSIDDRLAYGITHAGGFVGNGEPLLDPDYRLIWGQRDSVGIGQRHDTTWDFGTGIRGHARVYTKGAEGARQVYYWHEQTGEVRVSDGTGDNWAPQLNNGRVLYLTNVGGPTSLVNAEIPVVLWSPEVELIVFDLSYGQSLDQGTGTSPATVVPPSPHKLLSFNHGVRRPNDLVSQPLEPEEIDHLVPAISQYGEPPIMQQTAMCVVGANPYPANVGVVAETYALGGAAIAGLQKGTVPYQNCITAATRLAVLGAQDGLPVKCPKVSFRQGESDRAAAPGAYTTALLQLHADLDADLRAALPDQTEPIKILLDQMSAWTYYGLSESNVPFEQLEIALAHPDKFVCAGPKYQYETVDGRHQLTASSQRLGAKFAEPAVAIQNGQGWLPTYATSAVRAGSAVTVAFHTPHGPLVLDTTLVTDPGNYGVEWADAGDGNVVSITGVTVNNDNTVTVDLSAVPTGTGQLILIAGTGTPGNWAGPTTGARACLRDSSLSTDLQGRPIYNWACHQRIAVTV